MSSQDDYSLTRAQIQQLLGFSFTAGEEEWMLMLEARINELIVTDFARLLELLYRLDVEEEKVHAVLKQNPSVDAGRLIASLIMKRQMEKIDSRNKHRQQDMESEEERW
jgi:hypothetical protein